MNKLFQIFLILSFTTTVNAKDVWIDVRTPEEYVQGHVKNAVNIPHEEVAAGIVKLNLDKNTRIKKSPPKK